jgi:hypothetical protein
MTYVPVFRIEANISAALLRHIVLVLVVVLVLERVCS